MPEKKQMTLKDLLTYDADSYFSPEEMSIIRGTFGDNRVMRVLQKALVPFAGDKDTPIEELLGKDVWMSGIDFKNMLPEEVKIAVVARQDALKFIVGGLISLKIMANQKELSPEEKAFQSKQNSTK